MQESYSYTIALFRKGGKKPIETVGVGLRNTKALAIPELDRRAKEDGPDSLLGIVWPKIRDKVKWEFTSKFRLRFKYYLGDFRIELGEFALLPPEEVEIILPKRRGRRRLVGKRGRKMVRHYVRVPKNSMEVLITKAGNFRPGTFNEKGIVLFDRAKKA